MLQTFVQKCANLGLLITAIVLTACNKEKTANTIQSITISTKAAERKNYTLPDGTAVLLNACSSITYNPKTFAQKREIWGDGTLYVKVSNQSSSPLTFRFDSVKIATLNATFNFNNYSTAGKHGYQGTDNGPLPAKVTVVTGDLHVQTLFDANQWHSGYNGTIDRYMSMADPYENGREELTWLKGYYQYDTQLLGDFCRLASRMYAVHVLFGKIDENIQIHKVYLDLHQTKDYLLTDSTLNSKVAITYVNDSTYFAKPI